MKSLEEAIASQKHTIEESKRKRDGMVKHANQPESTPAAKASPPGEGSAKNRKTKEKRRKKKNQLKDAKTKAEEYRRQHAELRDKPDQHVFEQIMKDERERRIKKTKERQAKEAEQEKKKIESARKLHEKMQKVMETLDQRLDETKDVEGDDE